MPINLETINAHFGTSFTPQEACDFIRAEIAKEHIASPANFEEAAISQVGRALYEAFIKGYSLKQWGRPPHELPASLFGRMPVRFDYREDYFVNCRWQGLPLKGYAGLFKAFLSSPKIQTVCGQSWTPGNGDVVPQRQTIFTGALDELYNYRFGPLEWRSVRFDRSVLDMRDFQGTAVMNYADASVEWTRIHEPRHLHSERAYPDDRTVIIRETPEANATDRFYPVSTRENLEKLERYRALAAQDRTLVVGGRLGAYRYLDMDAAILSALECYETTIYPSAGA
jgi:UDP-galactopyranose mutase